ncbi:glycosyltransferase [Paenibacillus qinlingensis]|nr:glycosyltransferase [Paenibacillus qinlingensis]
MIVKNEENALPACLKSVAGIPDEIIIVDTGSTDRTKELAATFTDKIYDFQWIDHFAAARNFAFSKATKDYILWLDADDVVLERDRRLFLDLIRTMNPLVDRVTMPYNLGFDANGNVSTSLRRNRLVRRDRHFQWIGPVHEYLAASGSFLDSDVAITHKKDKEYTDRNLRIYRKRLEQGEKFGERDLFYFANELRDHAQYEEATTYYLEFLATNGWVEDKINATLNLADCYAHLNDRDAQMMSLLRAFELDQPRAVTCCRIGAIFINERSYEQAVYWYEKAYQTPGKDSIALTDHSAWTWLPHIQLCLCYDRLGDVNKAKQHNDIAYSYHPTHPAILHNRAYFAKVLTNPS